MRKLIPALIALLTATMILPEIQTDLYAARGGNNNANRALNRTNQAGKNARNMTRRNARPDGTDGPLANINEDWYLEFTPGYIRAGGSALDTFYGATVALGYRLSLEDRIQLEIGIYGSNNYSGAIAYDRVGTYDGMAPNPNTSTLEPVTNTYTTSLNGARSAKAKMVPLLLSYSYSIRLDSAERWEFRLSPAAGLINMFGSWNLNGSGSYTAPNGTTITDAPGGVISPDGSTINVAERFSGSKMKSAFAFGGGFGVTYYFADRWYADAGYRYLWTAKVSNPLPAGGTPWNGTQAWNGLNAHVYTLTLGWKF